MGFQEKVWELTRRIPAGKVTTYKELARALHTRAFRAVGQALHRNPFAPIVPCHRVVASDGSLGGFATGVKKKAAMLQREGIRLQNDRINLKKYFFRIKKHHEK